MAADTVDAALKQGATDAEFTISEGEEFSVSVRMREVESVKEAGSRGAGVRVLVGQRTGSSYTSDLSPEGIAAMVKAALALAKITSEDPHAGLPEREILGKLGGDLRMSDEAIARLATPVKIEMAKRAERAALDFDPRIQNSEGAGFSHLAFAARVRELARIRGQLPHHELRAFRVSDRQADGLSMERDYWYTAARSLAELESPEDVGRIAAERAIRRLNPRKVPTQKAPILFEPRTARALLGDIFDAVNGSSIYRHASFLAGKLGEKIAAENVTIVDDATIPGLFGTCPFDDEGVASRRTMVIEKGVLASYLLNTYTARKLGLKTTGNASRGITGNAGVGPGNFFLEAGKSGADKILAGIPERTVRYGADRRRRRIPSPATIRRARRACGSRTANWRILFRRSPSRGTCGRCFSISRRSDRIWNSAAPSRRPRC